MQYTDKVVDQ